MISVIDPNTTEIGIILFAEIKRYKDAFQLNSIYSSLALI